MKFLDRTFGTADQDLACDEVLLEEAENGRGGEVLRFWEPSSAFVVVGYSNEVRTETKVSACKEKGIPVYRRVSGGGTILQAPGCLNYALVLGRARAGSVRDANRVVMETNRAAMEELLGESVEVRGHTDLCLGELKFSGNSQRRLREFFLFHGTFLLDADLDLVSETLAMPSLEPDYRRKRSHAEFLVNLKRPAAEVKAALKKAWGADSPLEEKKIPAPRIRELGRSQYSDPAWNGRH